MRVAAIGIGSNSLRMLVADVDEGRLFRLKRYREGLRVFAALDRDGNIMADMILAHISWGISMHWIKGCLIM